MIYDLKRNLNTDGHQFHQYQQNQQSMMLITIKRSSEKYINSTYVLSESILRLDFINSNTYFMFPYASTSTYTLQTFLLPYARTSTYTLQAFLLPYASTSTYTLQAFLLPYASTSTYTLQKIRAFLGF
jgi:hypothetical protein